MFSPPCCSSSCGSWSPENLDRERPRAPLLEESGCQREGLQREPGETRTSIRAVSYLFCSYTLLSHSDGMSVLLSSSISSINIYVPVYRVMKCMCMTVWPIRRPTWETPRRPISASAACWGNTTTLSLCRLAAWSAVSCVANLHSCSTARWQQVREHTHTHFETWAWANITRMKKKKKTPLSMCSNLSRGQRLLPQRGPLRRHGGGGGPSPLPAAAGTVWRPGGALPPTPPTAEQFHRLRKLSLQLAPRLRHLLLGGWTGWESPHIVVAVVGVWTWGSGACRQCSSHDWWAGTLQGSCCLSAVGQGACNNVWGIMWF